MGAKFPIMQKCEVNGEKAHPMFKTLRKQTECFYNGETGKIKNIPWNFSKFVIDSEGKIIMYGNPRDSFYRNIDEIEILLGLKGDPKEVKRAIKKLIQSTKS